MTMFRRLRRAHDSLQYEAKHDALSGLPNRVEMVEKIESFLHRHTVGLGNRRAVAAYIDIDRFKDINDTLGHEAGDQLIKAVGQRSKARLRPQDFLSRFGGDEFAILGMPVGSGGDAAIADRIAQAFALPFSVHGQSIRVTASVGLAVAPDNGVTADELMRHADIALYEAKNQGRDRAVFFSAEMAERVEHRRSIEVDLRTALEANQLRLHYQPIISCGTGAIVGVEALLRWHHPVQGEISPAEFIPIAENSGLLPVLGEWVLDQAMKDAKRWPDLEVAVNLSRSSSVMSILGQPYASSLQNTAWIRVASFWRSPRTCCWRQLITLSPFSIPSARWASKPHSMILAPVIRAWDISAISSSRKLRSTARLSAECLRMTP